MPDDVKLPEPALYVGTKLVPYEPRMFSAAGMRESLGYTILPVDYYTADQVRAAALADREARQPTPRELDMAMLIKRLVRDMQIAWPATTHCKIAHEALEALRRWGLLGSPLRGGAETDERPTQRD